MRPPISYEIIAKAMFDNYESIYVIDWESGAYSMYHESPSYKKLQLSRSGPDFFQGLKKKVPEIICREDQAFVLKMLKRENILRGLEDNDHYSFMYRIHRDRQDIYHQIRVVLQEHRGKNYLMMGIRDVDQMVRRDLGQLQKIESMHQKEKNYLEAVLDSAEGYLEANLSKNIILECSPILAGRSIEDFLTNEKHERLSYQQFVDRFCQELVVKGREKVLGKISRDSLTEGFSKGEKRVYERLFLRLPDGSEQPCSLVFFLYRDNASGDIHSFGVLYDLTEQQKREMELEALENELSMSRLRNFTSQMQPHFLYNALGSIQEIVLEEPEYASRLIGDFAVHLRSCIRAMASDQPFPFTQELENIRAYANIECMRFGDKLKIRYDIGCEDFAILPLSIQPLVENAIRHGIYHRGTAGGTVSIRTRDTGTHWVIEVEDDGIGFDVEAYRKDMESGKIDSTGLKNLIFRLDKMMHSSVDISSVPGKGTTVSVLIPKGGKDL